MGQIIDETERELIIISPYLQISEEIYLKLCYANSRGVETILIYRENQLSESERIRLLSLDNLNLMHHPTVHAKCMYNEKFLLIGSMNLYEYSAKNNREMGVVFERTINDPWGSDDEDVFEDALEEINEIKNSAEMERASRETITEGFELEILKSKVEKSEEYLRNINKIFIYKKFISHDLVHDKKHN
ncbi:phospholipase D-like domain-containing protein [Flavobacterium cyanobacteriorum]|nr:phospholipase D-like domain-containing protein [Flavobacterium cyanobacteriorum]